MISGKMKIAVLFVIALLLSAWNIAAPEQVRAAGKPIVLKVANRFPPPPSDASRFVLEWCERVKKKSGGRVDFKYYWGGSMVSAPEELSMLGNRVFDIGVVSWVVQPGITPLGTVDWAVPFNTSDCNISLQAKKGLYAEIPEIMAELTKQNVKPMLWFPMKQFWLYTKFPINTLDDLKGKKIGCSGRNLTRFMKACGAVTVSNLVGDKYEMLQRGVTEGDLMSFFFMTDFKLYEVVNYLYKINIGRAVTVAYSVNMDTWKSLPKDIQDIMTQEARATEEWECAMEPIWAKEKMQKWIDAGVKIGSLPREEEVKWAERLKGHPQKWADEYEAKGLPGKKVMSRYIQLLQENGEDMHVKYEIK
ncbi:MAG: TRAP transporter substrate-binding protein DctP [Deltaproteobacteria bacterium]|nr:TRAP transporter substrate-binding protein DctP [Deltaproteobacteria bacterium]